MPCQNPLKIEGQQVACRRCDYCVGRRIRSWCVRAMMEKAAMGNALVIALTYSEKNEHTRRSAQMFDYRDIQEFMWNLRRQVKYHMKRTSAVSFIAAGEKGDRFGRCHWHLILFSEVDLLAIGKWLAPWGPVTDRSDIISPVGVKEPWRRNWSLWDHGFVTVQEPDYGGMRYAMSYALKDQFNVRNAQGTGREAKAEVFGTGYLAMSKKPPIGARFVDNYVNECRAAGIVPPSRRLSVPGVERPWWPIGQLADRLLAGLAQVNREIHEKTGANGAGWSTLLHEARDSDNDLETLGVYDGEEIDEESVKTLDRQIKADHADASEGGRLKEIRRRCGSTEACTHCLRGRADLADHGIYEGPDGFYRETDPWITNINGHLSRTEPFRRRQRDNLGGGPNPLCARYSTPALGGDDLQKLWPKQSA